MIAADPCQGGATWAVLQYLLGFRALGHDVYFIEPVSEENLRPSGAALHDSVNAGYFREVVSHFELEHVSALVETCSHDTVGLAYAELSDIAARSDLLVNISGMLELRELVDPIPVRLYLDLDPGFVQVWYTQGVDMRFAGHTHFATVGQAIGRNGCLVPDCGLKWITTFQPVCLPHWKVSTDLQTDALTTAGNWRVYGSVEHRGMFMGQKAHSLRPLFGLPRKVEQRFCLAMAIHPDESRDLEALNENAWEILDPMTVAATPMAYQEFVRGSLGEFGIAKSGYVVSRSGWFSDRSACYLASGRPVIAQDTGCGQYLPTGEGLFLFDTEEDVIAALDSLDRDYPRHARAARHLAETYFDSDKVLSLLLKNVGATA